MICIGPSCPVNSVIRKAPAAPSAPGDEDPGLLSKVWNDIVDIAKFAVGAEDSSNMPPVVPVVIMAGCSGDLEPTNQIEQLREDGVNMKWEADAVSDGAIKDGAWKFQSADMEVSGTGERYQQSQVQAASGILAGEGWDKINKMEILVYLNPYLIGQDIVDAGVCEPGMYNISLDDVAEAAKLEHTRLPITVIGYTIRDNITEKEVVFNQDNFAPAVLEAFCADSETANEMLRLPVPENFYPQDSSDPHQDRMNITLTLDLEIDNTNVYDPNAEYLTYIKAELEAD